MECAKQFSITVDPASVCPALLNTIVAPSNLEGVAGAEPTGFLYVAPITPGPTDIWKYDTSGAFIATIPLAIGVTGVRWIEYIPSTNHFHMVAFDTVFPNPPLIQIMDVAGNMLGNFIIPDQGFSAISYDTTINRSFMYETASNLLEFNGDAIDRTINIGIDTGRVAVVNGKIYCPDASAHNKVRVINYISEAVVTDIVTSIGDWVITVGGKVFGLAFGAPTRIIVIDPLTDTVTNTIAIDAGDPSGNGYQLSYLPATGLLYAFTTLGGYAIDPVTETVFCQFSALSQSSSQYALYGGTGVDTVPSLFVPEFGTTNLRKYG